MWSKYHRQRGIPQIHGVKAWYTMILNLEIQNTGRPYLFDAILNLFCGPGFKIQIKKIIT